MRPIREQSFPTSATFSLLQSPCPMEKISSMSRTWSLESKRRTDGGLVDLHLRGADAEGPVTRRRRRERSARSVGSTPPARRGDGVQVDGRRKVPALAAELGRHERAGRGLRRRSRCGSPRPRLRLLRGRAPPGRHLRARGSWRRAAWHAARARSRLREATRTSAPSRAKGVPRGGPRPRSRQAPGPSLRAGGTCDSGRQHGGRGRGVRPVGIDHHRDPHRTEERPADLGQKGLARRHVGPAHENRRAMQLVHARVNIAP